MKVIAGEADRRPLIASGAALIALFAFAFGIVVDFSPGAIAAVSVTILLLCVSYRVLLQWPFLLAVLLLVILFIPIRRYTMPGDLPFELEPYRLLVAFIAAGWLAALLVDPRVRLRASGLKGPIALFFLAIIASLVMNGQRVANVQADVVKNLTFFSSFFVLFYLIVSTIRTSRHVDALLKVLVTGGAVLAILAVFEARTGYNVFNRLDRVIPYLEQHFIADSENLARGARLRALGPAEHPIALGALFAMLMPLGVYLARLYSRRWTLAAGALLVGAVGTVSRTTVVMLVAIAVTALWLRPRETKRFWPLLVPMVVLIHFALPGTLGSLKASFFPSQGLIAQQSDPRPGAGRISSARAAIEEFKAQPLFGQGFSTRVVTGKTPNAIILDNQWLEILVETGVVGGIALLWLVVRFLRRIGREAKRDVTERGFLLAAICASIAAFVVGMLTYDAFAFTQVTFVFFVLLAIGTVVLRIQAHAPVPVSPDENGVLSMTRPAAPQLSPPFIA